MYGSRARGAGLLIAAGLVCAAGICPEPGNAVLATTTSAITSLMLPRIVYLFRRVFLANTI
jgi:hypothetical protein